MGGLGGGEVGGLGHGGVVSKGQWGLWGHFWGPFDRLVAKTLAALFLDVLSLKSRASYLVTPVFVC